ncbi:MAG: phosphatidylglycerol lysyltransferase domain-containing protein, partial [Muribaculaceae bacterium]|nr:phosphatidylglycerol lysyltransferase domain-containing protein [Muribaculaceae bacterium]
LYVHVEKASRAFEGSYEKINKEFAALMCARHPEIRFINREDDSGDEGLRKAKLSYHPVEILKKYNIAL